MDKTMAAMLIEKDLPDEAVKAGFSLPANYKYVGLHGLTNLEPWYFIDGKEFHDLCGGINKRYSDRLVVPFARRKDCDDVACFVVRSNVHSLGQVLIIHDYASAGYEIAGEYSSFWDWFRSAMEDMINWAT